MNLLMRNTYVNHFKLTKKQFKIAVTFLTGFNGIFNYKNSNDKFYFKKSIADADGFIQNIIPPGAYELESLNKENKKIIIDKGHCTQKEYPFTIKPNFSNLGSVIEILQQGPIISFVFNDGIRNLLGFQETILYKEYNQSRNPVDIISLIIFSLKLILPKEYFLKGNELVI